MSGQHTMQVDQYTIDLGQLLGRGAFGNVHPATNADGFKVAAKQISCAEHPDAHMNEVKNFYEQPPKHKNLIEILGFSLRGDIFWLFMQYAEHGDLVKYFKDYSNLLIATKDKLSLMKQITRGIAYLHECDIVHRDIKPRNILVSGSHIPGEAVIKITDLGLAKHLNPNDITSAMSSFAGTESFKAPEFWNFSPDGTISYHRSVDTFAAGLTFLAMLQMSEGCQLTPYIEDSIDLRIEGRQPIGLVMVNRQKYHQTSVNPVKDKEDDDSLTRGVKQVIRRMVQMVPEYRLPMQAVSNLLSDENALIREVQSFKDVL